MFYRLLHHILWIDCIRCAAARLAGLMHFNLRPRAHRPYCRRRSISQGCPLSIEPLHHTPHPWSKCSGFKQSRVFVAHQSNWLQMMCWSSADSFEWLSRHFTRIRAIIIRSQGERRWELSMKPPCARHGDGMVALYIHMSGLSWLNEVDVIVCVCSSCLERLFKKTRDRIVQWMLNNCLDNTSSLFCSPSCKELQTHITFSPPPPSWLRGGTGRSCRR